MSGEVSLALLWVDFSQSVQEVKKSIWPHLLFIAPLKTPVVTPFTGFLVTLLQWYQCIPVATQDETMCETTTLESPFGDLSSATTLEKLVAL